MSQTEGTERVLSKTVAWGTGRNDLRAIAVVGSHARSDHPADAWSDLDLIFMARRPSQYLDSSGWLSEIETPWLAVREPTVVGGEEILHITFEVGTKVDLVVVSSVAFSLAARTLQMLGRRPSLSKLLPESRATGWACSRSSWVVASDSPSTRIASDLVSNPKARRQRLRVPRTRRRSSIW